MDAETLFNAAGPPRHSAANTVFRTYKHFAVVDVETPGQHRNDSIVEVAVVVVDRKGRIRDEWETLINPGGGPSAQTPAAHMGCTPPIWEGRQVSVTSVRRW